MYDDKRARQAAQTRARSSDPVYREMMRWANIAAANRRKAKDPVWRAKVSAAITLKYQDPEYHSKMAAHARANGKLGGRPRSCVLSLTS